MKNKVWTVVNILLLALALFIVYENESYIQTIDQALADEYAKTDELEKQLKEEQDETDEVRQQALEYKDKVNQIEARNEGIMYQETNGEGHDGE